MTPPATPPGQPTPSTPPVPPASSTGLAAFVRRRPLTSFFVLSYAVSWLLWSPMLILGISPFDPVTHTPSLALLPGIAIGVTGSAFLLTAVIDGRAGVRRLLQRLTWWRVGVQWFAVAILLIPLSEVVATVAFGSPDVLGVLSPSALLLYPGAYLAHFVFGPLFEESGWRGFALPRMQHRFGPMRGTLLLGVLWSAWHFFLYVPVWFSSGLVAGILGVVIFTVTTTAMSFLFTWLSNNTQGSVLLCVLLHGSVDGTATYVQVLADDGVIPQDAAGTFVLLGLLTACVVGALVVIAATRGRLGYPRYRDEAEHLDLDPSGVRRA